MGLSGLKMPWIWPSVTDMQYYYHARYPTDDWHLAYMFSLVYFSVEVCLEGVFPHSVSTWLDSCVAGLCPPHAGFPPHKNEGTFELTHGSSCIIFCRANSVFFFFLSKLLYLVIDCQLLSTKFASHQQRHAVVASLIVVYCSNRYLLFKQTKIHEASRHIC